MKIFKIEAEGDVVYIEAMNLEKAKDRLEKFMGIIPDELLTCSVVDNLPDGEEFL